jgi:hypothetical protein
VQLLHEVTQKSIFGRNDKGEKQYKASVLKGRLTDGSPVIGMTMLPGDFKYVPLQQGAGGFHAGAARSLFSTLINPRHASSTGWA